MKIRMLECWFGEMLRRLRAFTALTEGPVFDSQYLYGNSVTLLPEDLIPSYDLFQDQAHMWHLCTHANKTPKKNNYRKNVGM